MKTRNLKLTFLFVFLTFSTAIFAQSSGGGDSYLLPALGMIVLVLLIGALFMLTDNLMQIEAKKAGVEDKGNFSLFPQLKEVFSPKLPKGIDLGGEEVRVLKQGYDINLAGKVKGDQLHNVPVSRFAMQPQNFIGISPIPKVEPQIGDNVLAGQHLFYDKKKPEIKYTAPVSGEVIAIERGEKRAIKEIVILADKEINYRSLPAFDLNKASREELVNFLLDSGFWPSIRQRPYNVVAEPEVIPSNIFISTFDSAPLAPDNNLIVKGQGEAFQKGLNILNMLTDGSVYLGLNAKGAAAEYKEASGVQKTYFYGAHPAGNVGVQIHHTNAMKTTDKVWTLQPQAVINLGNIFLKNRYEAKQVVAITGDEIKEPKLVSTYTGASIEDLLKDNVTGENIRVISGDVLSGEEKEGSSFVNFFDDQITIVEEGDDYEMFGWLVPFKSRPSVSATYPNFLLKDTEFKANTNSQGEKRAFVLTGQYEKMLPMDILPQHLMKAILANDYERMEGLGINELVEEDIALAEFSCTSKQPLQKILRQGLEMMREQG